MRSPMKRALLTIELLLSVGDRYELFLGRYSLMGERCGFGAACCPACELKVTYVVVGEVLVAFVHFVV